MNTQKKVYTTTDLLMRNLFCVVCGKSSRGATLHSDPDKRELSLICNHCKTCYVDEQASDLNFQVKSIKESTAYKYMIPLFIE